MDGNITSWNPGAEHLLGWSEAEIIGKSACIFFTDDDKVNGVCDAEMAGAARDGRAEDERWHQRKDGSCIWASGLMMRFEAEDSDEHIGYIKILRDRTPSTWPNSACAIASGNWRRHWMLGGSAPGSSTRQPCF